jgi:hypothetical protein
MTAVVRWRRYGHDRLYVTGQDGNRLGYHDLRTGLAHEVPEAGRAEFNAAAARFRGTIPAGNLAAEEPLAAGHGPTGRRCLIGQPVPSSTSRASDLRQRCALRLVTDLLGLRLWAEVGWGDAREQLLPVAGSRV